MELIDSKRQLQQQLLTYQQHMDAIRLRLSEIYMRRIKKKQVSQRSVVQRFDSAKMYKMSLELDRFTTSYSRLVFRGVYSDKCNLSGIKTMLAQALQEYDLLQ